MTYRDDLEAAQARADAAETKAASLEKQVEALKGGNAPVAEVPIPTKFNLQKSVEELVVSWRWFNPAMHTFLLFFVIAWDAFLLFWYFGAPSRDRNLLFMIFPIAHVAVGVALTYFVLTGFVNRTTVRASKGVLTVSHGPLPWIGNHRIARADLKQLYVTEMSHPAKHGRITHSWDLCALLDNNRAVRLLTRLDSYEQGMFLERTFEDYMNIADTKVAGEVQK
jgi:hypothetical protein